MIDFDKLIEQHLFRELRPKTLGRYYPSEIGGCLRKVWYTYKFPKPLEMDLVKVFEVGNIMHHFVAQVLRSEKVKDVKLLEEELPFKMKARDFTISGRVDDVLLVVASGEKVLVEVKSTADLSYVEEPSPQHLMQLQLYMHAIKIHKGALLYIEKATLKTKTFAVAYDERAAAEALARFAKLHQRLTENKVPLPEARMIQEKNWLCKRCEHRERCWGDTSDEELKKIMEKWDGGAL